MHRHHSRALLTIAAATALDAALGAWFGAADHIGIPDGLFFATTTATTVGYGDLTAHGWLPHVLAVIMMLTVIPLFAATFSLLTSGLASQDIHARVTAAEKRIKDHVDKRHKQMASHVTTTIGGGA
jgi:voltage-gated potassium channel